MSDYETHTKRERRVFETLTRFLAFNSLTNLISYRIAPLIVVSFLFFVNFYATPQSTAASSHAVLHQARSYWQCGSTNCRWRQLKVCPVVQPSKNLFPVFFDSDSQLTKHLKSSVCSELTFSPPPTNDQMPSSWWKPQCCDKSLLVGTYKHGCENYRTMRYDPLLCYVTHLGLTDDAPLSVA